MIRPFICITLCLSNIVSSAQYVYEDNISGESFGHLQLIGPYSTAYNAVTDKIYVAEPSNSRIVVLDPDGSLHMIISQGHYEQGGFLPYDIDIDQSGKLYIADPYANRIHVYDLNGNLHSYIESSDTHYPWSIEVHGDIIYVADAVTHKIHRFSTDGVYFGTMGAADVLCYYVATDPAGYLYISGYNNGISIYDPSGAYITDVANIPDVRYSKLSIDESYDIWGINYSDSTVVKISTPGGAPYYMITGHTVDVLPFDDFGVSVIDDIAFSPGRGYATDYAHNHIIIFDSETNEFAEHLYNDMNDGQLNYPDDIAVDASGRLFVTDSYNHRIQVFDRHGNFIFKFGTFGSDDGQLKYPHEIAIDEVGMIYVMDMTNYISRFDSNGNFVDRWDAASIAPLDNYSRPTGGLAVDENSIYLYHDPTKAIEVYDKNWAYQRSISSPGTGDEQVQDVTDLEIDSLGNLYAMVQSQCKVFSNDGDLLNTNPSTLSVAVSTDGDVALINDAWQLTINNSVLNNTQVLDLQHLKNVGFNSVDFRSVAFGKDRLYVSDGIYSRIYIFSTLPNPGLQLEDFDANYGDDQVIVPVISETETPISIDVISGNDAHVESGLTLGIDGAGEVTIEAKQDGTSTHRKGSATATLTISKKNLTVSTNPSSSVYGDVPNQPTQVISGFKSGDTVDDIDILPTSSLNVNELTPPGEYPVVISGGNDDNYDFTYEQSTHIVSKAALIFAVSDTIRVYGDANPVFTGAYDGFRNSDTAEDIDSAPALLTSATILSPVGDYNIVAQGGEDDKYVFSYQTGSMTIFPRLITARAEDKSRQYLSAEPEFTIQYEVFVNGENSDVLSTKPTVGTSASPNSPVGTYPIVFTGNGIAQNYIFNYVEGILTITKADQLITFSSLAETLKKSDSPIELNASASSGLVVSFSIESGPGEILGNIYTITEPGFVTITASQPGDANFNGAAPISRTVEIIDDLVVGVEDLNEGVTVHPNPASDKLRVQATGGIRNIHLIDSNGRTVLSTAHESQQEVYLSLANIAHGLYVLSVETPSGKKVRRRVVVVK